MSEIKRITTPLTDAIVEGLHAGDSVLITGVIYTGRDLAHARLIEALDRGETLPADLRGQIIYYVGPAPAKPGYAIGPAGPTTSYRMDAYTPRLLDYGLKGMIGKGNRTPEVIESMKKNKAVYFAAIGGAAAVIAKCIKKADMVAYEDLGPEALQRLEVVDMPATVVNDCHGNDLYVEGMARYARTAAHVCSCPTRPVSAGYHLSPRQGDGCR
ncbi:MAG TPA: Fe-S-containing hydro-lyase [bacterium]|nr:Fe-S-containing hydro-lyase [bacterium]